MNKEIYFDNAATTKISEEVLEAMLPYLKSGYGNPGSIYKLGADARRAVDNARKTIAEIIGASPKEIHFTSGGTESNNWAIKGITGGKNHIITTEIEHLSVLHPCEYLEKHGFKITYLPLNSTGITDPDDLNAALSPDTGLISVALVNNELGTVQPIKEIGETAKKNNILFHTDAVQALGHLPINVREQNIDLISMSAHKIHGPKGIGALYIKEGTMLSPLLHGGSQERNRRAGTENTANIVGFAKALEILSSEMKRESLRLKSLTEKIISKLLKMPGIYLNGDRENRVPGIFNISVPGINGEDLVILLGNKNIFVSSGAACSAGSLEISHVITALGHSYEHALGSLRISLSLYNTEAEADEFLKIMPEMIRILRDD